MNQLNLGELDNDDDAEAFNCNIVKRRRLFFSSSESTLFQKDCYRDSFDFRTGVTGFNVVIYDARSSSLSDNGSLPRNECWDNRTDKSLLCGKLSSEMIDKNDSMQQDCSNAAITPAQGLCDNDRLVEKGNGKSEGTQSHYYHDTRRSSQFPESRDYSCAHAETESDIKVSSEMSHVLTEHYSLAFKHENAAASSAETVEKFSKSVSIATSKVAKTIDSFGHYRPHRRYLNRVVEYDIVPDFFELPLEWWERSVACKDAKRR
jgi:hypothetical protein